jgi:hypothetical protein
LSLCVLIFLAALSASCAALAHPAQIRRLSSVPRRVHRQSSICAGFLHSGRHSRGAGARFLIFPLASSRGAPQCSAELARPGLAALVHQLGPCVRCPKWRSFFVSFRFFGCWQGSPVATDFLRQCSFSCCPGFILLAVLVSCSRASVPRPESLLRISIAGDGSSTGSSSGFPIQLLQLVSNSRSGPILGSESRWKIFFS